MLGRCRRQMFFVAAFSVIVNILTLNSALYMLQVYDRVIVSGSAATLITLTALMIGVFVVQGTLDAIRQKLLVRVAALFETAARAPVHAAMLQTRSIAGRPDLHLLHDLGAVRGFLSGSGPSAVMDLPFAVVFAGIIFLVHPALGLLALGGAVVLVGLTLLAERLGRKGAAVAATAAAQQMAQADATLRAAETVQAMGMAGALVRRFEACGHDAMRAQVRQGDLTGGLTVTTRVLRVLLQSLMLGLGAFLVIRGSVSGGAILAASVLVGRALAPVDLLIGNWRGLVQARGAVGRLLPVLHKAETTAPMALPAPASVLDLTDVGLCAPDGAAVLAGVEFSLAAGDVLGVVGPSGCGKSTLLRAVLGLVPVARGTIRLDGATLDQWTPAALGPHVGYVPQSVALFDATIAENIARMGTAPDAAQVIAAARSAGVHEMILTLPQGYDTRIGDGFGPLSIGQRQRVALARALYGKPFLIVLDEANANLDPAGEAALVAAIAAARARGAIVIMATHRMAALSACTHILALRDGGQRAFGTAADMLGPKTAQPSAMPPSVHSATDQRLSA